MREERQRRRQGGALTLFYLLLAVASAWFTADWVRGKPLVSEAPSFDSKLAEFLAREPVPDVAFLGSSRVFRGIDPAAFDAETAAAGHATNSFNLAMPGMHAIEIDYAARTLLPAAAGRLDTLFVAPGYLTDALAGQNERSRRVIDFHDEQATLLSLRQAWWQERGPYHSIDIVRRHLSAWWYRRASVGQLRERILARWSDPERQRDQAQGRDERSLGPNRDGFVSLDLAYEWNPDSLVDRRTQLLENLQKWARIVERHKTVGLEPIESVPPVLPVIIDRIAAEAAAAGVRLIFLIPPTTHFFVPMLKASLAERPDLTVFDFSNTEEFPSLYDPRLWFDFAHLNTLGAARFSSVLAEHWLAQSANPKAASGTDR